MPDSPRTRFRQPHWGWCLLGTILVVAGYVGLSVWLPWRNEQQVIQQIKGWGGEAKSDIFPGWLTNTIGEEQAKTLQVFERVTVVNLHNSKVTDEDIAQISGLERLKELHLGSTLVTGPGLEHLKEHSSLEHLSLEDTWVSNTSMAFLVGVRKLKHLDLSTTLVTDAGLADLKQLPCLKYLYLQRTRVSDTGLKHLRELKNLKELALAGAKVTDAGVADLERALPELTIYK